MERLPKRDPNLGVGSGAGPHRGVKPGASSTLLDKPTYTTKRTPGSRRRFEKLKREQKRRGLKTIAESRPGGLGVLIPGARAALGDVKEIGYGVADAAADYGTAVGKDIVRSGGRSDRTARLAARDALGLLVAAEMAIPEPKWVPEWMRKEVVEVDPENLTIRRGSGRVDREDTKRAGKFWRENPLIGALLVTPAGSAAARRASRGAIQGSIRRANPDIPKRDARRLARKESKLPGYAAAHGVAGGIKPRVLKGEAGEATGRPWSRTPVGRAGQRAYDRGSALIEATRGPGAKFATSQRAARAKQRELTKERSRTQAEASRLERIVRKGIGKLGRDRPGQEAIIAVLEAPKGLTPRQAVEIKLADLRSTIERPRTSDEARARVAALDRELERGLRPLVDQEFPATARQREQALRNARPRGKRAARGIEAELEMTGIRGSRQSGGSVLADAHAQIEARIVEAAGKPDADPTVRKVAAMIAERDRLREQASDPEVVFGEATGEFGVTGASPAATKRLAYQVKALERALERGIVDSDDFANAVGAAETLSRQADESAKTVLGMSDEDLAARRNVVARRYADRGLLPEGVEPDARGFFPHRDEFERVGGSMGAPTLAATGGVVGRPMPGRAFERRQNELRLYEQGRVQTSPRVLSNTVRQRSRYEQTQAARGYLYQHGREIQAGEQVPKGTMFVRNPDASPETIPPNVRAAVESPDAYDLATRAGDAPDAKTFDAWVDTFLYRGHGPAPKWLSDVKNVRVVPERIARTLLTDVFQSAPRGSFQAFLGTLNSLARFTTIYTPYGGTRYVAKNTPQNMILLAVTQPKAFLNLRQATVSLRRKDPELYHTLLAETGTTRASAGLPELPGRRQTTMQRGEGAVTDLSRTVASGLSTITDDPWRVSSLIGYMKEGDFKTPADWRRLQYSDDPALVRFRNDLAQKTRDDMLDFDGLPPGARETLSRIFFILPFRYGAAKWPFMYLREHPAPAAIASLIAAQHAREETPGRATSVLESGRTEVGGHELDLGWLFPHMPSAGTAEDIVKTIEGLDPDNINLRPLAGSLAPQYRSAVDAAGYSGEPTEQVAGAFLPGFSTQEKIRKGGGVGEQVLRGLGSTIDYIEPSGDSVERARLSVRDEARELLQRVGSQLSPEDRKVVRGSFSRKTAVEVARARARRESGGDKDAYARAAYRGEIAVLLKWGVLDKAAVSELSAWSEKASLEEVKHERRLLVEHAFDDAYLDALRYFRGPTNTEKGN